MMPGFDIAMNLPNPRRPGAGERGNRLGPNRLPGRIAVTSTA
jgi:hypothetical protein